MIENLHLISDKPDHPLTKLVTETILANTYFCWITEAEDDPQDVHQFVNAQGVCWDFVYFLNKKDRLRIDQKPVANWFEVYNQAVDEITVRAKMRDLAFSYTYGGDDQGDENIMVVKEVYAALIKHGFITSFSKTTIITDLITL